MCEMHKEFQILKVSDIIEYKLSKLIHLLLKDSPRLSKVLHKLIFPTDTIHNRNTRKSNKFTVREKKRSEKDNSGVKTEIVTQHI